MKVTTSLLTVSTISDSASTASATLRYLILLGSIEYPIDLQPVTFLAIAWIFSGTTQEEDT